MLIIGLTGGIGSGKSTVTRLFASLGVPIIDTDIIARELVRPSQPAIAEIVAAFGSEILKEDGSLDRQAMRQQVFDSEQKRKQLETILHPRIREEVQRQLQQLTVTYCIVVIPLLLETGQQTTVQRILVVDTPPEQQLTRTLLRDQSDKTTVKKIITSQVDRQTRLAAADDVIHNQGNISELEKQVLELHQKYLKIASA